MTLKQQAMMAEATRLTRTGQLGAAMALLRGLSAEGAVRRDTPERDDVRPAQSQDWTLIPPSHAREPDVMPRSAPPLRQHGLVDGVAEVFEGPFRRGLQALADGFQGGGMVARDRSTGRAGGGGSAGGSFERLGFSTRGGSRSYRLYVPSRPGSEPRPLVVMLHGCQQSPEDFAAGTRMNELAEALDFLVAYPEQTSAANQSRCWNWFVPGEQARDGGEPLLIAGITRQIMRDMSVDPARVFIAGLSAGGAAAAIMAATYPELYAAVCVHSGLACGAARDMSSAFSAMQMGGAAQSGLTHQPRRTIVFHGDRDHTVNLVNGRQVIEQSMGSADFRGTATRGQSAAGMDYTRTVHTDRDGRPTLEHWVLHGLGHAWSGGSPAGSYTDPRGPDASREMMRFFLDGV